MFVSEPSGKHLEPADSTGVSVRWVVLEIRKKGLEKGNPLRFHFARLSRERDARIKGVGHASALVVVGSIIDR